MAHLPAILPLCPALLSIAALAAEVPSSPHVYPLLKSQITRTSEMAFAETEETLDYGYHTPFPEVERKSFRMADFGARPDGVTDCTPAFYRALAGAISARQPAEVVFSAPGRYLFRPRPALGSDEMAVLNVRGARDLLIRGTGHDTLLVIADPALGGLNVLDGDTVMLRDLAIDHDPLPFTQGKVVALDAEAGSFILRLDPGYLTPTELCSAIPGYHGGYVMLTARNAAYKWPSITGLAVSGHEPAGRGDWRFTTSDPSRLKGYLKVGDEFIFVGRRLAQMALGASDTRRFYVRNVAVHASPTCGLGLTNVDGVHIEGYANCIPIGSGRLLATNADGIYVHGARGGITVRESFFMGQGDDCINLHCPALAGRFVRLEEGGEVTLLAPVDVRAGDALEIMDPTSGRIKGQIRVEAATRAADRQSVRCALSAPLGSLGYDPNTDSLYPASISASNFMIVRNYFGQNRSRCLLIQARDGLIAANTVENAEGYGIHMGYGGTAWAEGVIPSRVVVRGNVFRNLTGVGLAGAVEMTDGSSHRNFRDITIADNRFINTRKMAVLAKGCVGLKITGNSVTTEPGRRNTWNHPEWYPVDCSVYLGNCSGVVVEGFQISDPGVREAAVYIASDCAAGAEGVQVTGVTAALPEGVPVVRDER